MDINNQQNHHDSTFDTLDISTQTLCDCVFEACQFKHCNFHAATLQKCTFIDCEFSACDLSMMQIPQTQWRGVVFESCKMLGLNWTQAHWPQVALTSPVQFYQCNLSQSTFFGLSLVELVMENCVLHEVDYREAELSRANFSKSDLRHSLFMHSQLTAADFSEAVNYHIDPTFNNISKAKFSFPEVVALLQNLDIEIIGIDD